MYGISLFNEKLYLPDSFYLLSFTEMSKSKTKQTNNDFAVEEVLQAVVIADSYNVRFAPISELTPRCLFPFAGATILDYALTNLHYHGIDEVIVYCTAHASKIRAHLERKWSQRLKVITIASDTASSVGDALRDLDSKDLIRSDFVLLHGDLLTNVNLKKLLLDHKKLREKNKSCIMTLVCKRAPPEQANLSLMYNPETRQILNFACSEDKRPQLRVAKKKVKSGKAKTYYLENGFRSTDIAICSVYVPIFMTENFDFPGILNVVKGCMVNVDIHGYSVHFHELCDSEETYRVRDMMQYSKLNFNVMQGLIAPFMPCLVSGMPYFLLDGRRSFIHARARLPPVCRLGNFVLIGDGTTIGERCVLQRCLIGRNCSIGDEVRLENCFIWDDVTIESNCSIKESILCSDVRVKTQTNICNRTVLSFNVVVGPCANLDAQILVGKEQARKLEPKGSFGKESVAYRYSRKAVTSVATEMTESDFGDVSLDVDYQKIWMHEDEESIFDKFRDEDEERIVSSDEGAFEDDEEDYEETFCRELKETLDRCTKESISTENVILDINSLKHTYYINIDVLHSLLTKCILEYPILTKTGTDPKSYATAITKLLKTLLGIFKNYIKDEVSSLSLLQSLEDTASEHPVIIDSCQKILYFFYDNDILKEDVILKWYEDTADKEEGNLKSGFGGDFSDDEDDGDEEEEEEEEIIGTETKSEDDNVSAELIRKALKPFIEWLRDAEEESDSD